MSGTLSSAGGLALKLWELDDDQLEAELQRQLDGLGSDEEGEVGGPPPAPLRAASPRVPHKAALPTGGENVANSANGLGKEVADVKEDLSVPSTLGGKSGSSGGGSAWAELMASMTAEQDHWSEYESELAVLRTSMAEYAVTQPPPSSNQLKNCEDTAVQQRANENSLFLTSLGNMADDDAIDDDDDNEGETVAAAATASALENPDKRVRDIRDRVNALMSDDEDVEAEGKSDESHNTDANFGASVKARQDKDAEEESPESSTSRAPPAPDPTSLRQHALHLINTTNTSMDILVSEAQDMMAPEEREWREASSAQDRALMEAMEFQADERARMENEQAAERERMEIAKQQKERDLKRDSERRAAEIEERSRAAAVRRAEEEAALKQQREEDRARMDELRKALEEAALEQERVIEEARREEQARQRQLTEMRVRWALEERSAKAIQKHFAAHKTRKLEQAEAEQREAARREAELLQRQIQEDLESAAVLTMQRVARGVRARSFVRSVREHQTLVALHAQRLARGAASRRRVNTLRAQRLTAAMNIQRVVRGMSGRHRAKIAHKSKRKHVGVQKIQTWWRCVWMTRNFLEYRCAVTVLGSVWRSKLVRMDLARRNRAAVSLQSVFRGHKCRQAQQAIAAARAEVVTAAEIHSCASDVWDERSKAVYYNIDGLGQEAAGVDDDYIDESFDLFPGRTISEIRPATPHDDALRSERASSACAGVSSSSATAARELPRRGHQEEDSLAGNKSASFLDGKENVNVDAIGRRGRVFPPSNEDQVLCKQNQRKHMVRQRRRWMAQRAASLLKDPLRGPASRVERREREDLRGESKAGSGNKAEGDVAAVSSGSVYSEWVDRAVTWQTIFSKNIKSETTGAGRPESFSMECFDTSEKNKKPTSSAARAHTEAAAKRDSDREKVLGERLKNKNRARQLKQELIDLGGKLRKMRDDGRSVDQIQSLVEEMKRMKEDYQSLVTTVARQKEHLAEEEAAWQQRVRGATAAAAKEDEGPATRFESSVECLTELPLEHLGEFQNLACIVANCNKIRDLNGLAEAVPDLRSLSLRDNCISDSGLADVALLASRSLEHLCVEMNQISSLEAIIVGTAHDDSGSGDADGAAIHSASAPPVLRDLLASNNRISDLSHLCGHSTGKGEAAPFPYLERLSLYRNSVQWIPRELTWSLKWLRHLDLGRNALMTLDGVHFGCMPLLQGLILYENKISDDALPALHNVLLKELWLNGNHLKELRFHGDASWVPSLENLHVHDNSIRKLSSLSSMPFVRSIDLSFNQIDEIEELRHLRSCPYVEVFRCNDNPVANHPDYRSRVLLAFPRLRELDGEAVEAKDHSAARNKVYGAQSHVIEAWLDKADFTSALQRQDLGMDWHEVLRCASASSVAVKPREDICERGEAAAWQAFEAMCRRHRAARDEMSRGHRRNAAEEKEQDSSGTQRGKARSMERAFQHDREMRRLILSQLKDHWDFDWEDQATRSMHNSVMDAKNASLIRRVESSNDDTREYFPLVLSHPRSQKAVEAGRMTSRSRVRPQSGSASVQSTSSSRPNSRMTSAAAAAVMFQCLYRGHRVRRRLVQSGQQRGMRNSARVNGGDGSGVGDDDDDEFGGVDLESFMGFVGIEGLEKDEFDIMQANSGPTVAYEPTLPPSSNSGVRTGAWAEASAHVIIPSAGIASYQQAAVQVAHSSFVADNLQEGDPTTASVSSEVVSLLPRAVPSSDEITYPPSPASCASSMGVGMRPGDMSMPGTPLMGQDTPMYQRRYRQKVRAQEQREEKVATEWGFEDKKTAQLMMMRQSRFQKAKREKKRRARLKDPEYKYKVLMRKVRDNMAKEQDTSARAGGGGGSVSTPGSRSSSRPPNSRSAVQRDRARHRKTRKVRLPAWASRESSSAARGSAGTDSASSDIRLESAGSNMSSTPFKVVEWGPKDILPPI